MTDGAHLAEENEPQEVDGERGHCRRLRVYRRAGLDREGKAAAPANATDCLKITSPLAAFDSGLRHLLPAARSPQQGGPRPSWNGGC